MSSIHIKKISITDVKADCIVNAANEHLAEGGGVCGAVFREAGAAEMTKACREIGYCKTGSAVITPGFSLPSKYVIHAVGPVWYGGDRGEEKALYSCYRKSLELAAENGIHSIAFPLISAGIFGYPQDKAWHEALRSCCDYIASTDYEIDIIFAVRNDRIIEMGEEQLKTMHT